MTDASERREFVIPRSTKHLQEVRDKTKECLTESNVPDQLARKMVLAVDEAVANVILHSHGSTSNGTVAVTIEANGVRAKITVENKGPYFDPTEYPDPDIQANIRMGTRPSLGIRLMKAIVDELKYTRKKDGTNVLVLTKNIA